MYKLILEKLIEAINGLDTQVDMCLDDNYMWERMGTITILMLLLKDITDDIEYTYEPAKYMGDIRTCIRNFTGKTTPHVLVREARNEIGSLRQIYTRLLEAIEEHGEPND